MVLRVLSVSVYARHASRAPPWARASRDSILGPLGVASCSSAALRVRVAAKEWSC